MLGCGRVGEFILPLFLSTTTASSSIQPPPPPFSRMMLVMLMAFLIAAFALLCIRIPSVWSALMAIDEPSDPHELGLVVASRASYAIPLAHTFNCVFPLVVHSGNPFCESGPPACMAKLIMMRHKVRKISSCAVDILTHSHLQLNQANTRRRRTSTAAQRTAPRQFTLPTPRQRPVPWIRIPKHFGLQHH